jgi:hypothetical protein
MLFNQPEMQQLGIMLSSTFQRKRRELWTKYRRARDRRDEEIQGLEMRLNYSRERYQMAWATDAQMTAVDMMKMSINATTTTWGKSMVGYGYHSKRGVEVQVLLKEIQELVEQTGTKVAERQRSWRGGERWSRLGLWLRGYGWVWLSGYGWEVDW